MRGLGNILAQDEFGFELLVEAGFPHGDNGSAAVRGVVGIGDGDSLDAGIEQRAEAPGREIERRVGRKPDHQVALSINYK